MDMNRYRDEMVTVEVSLESVLEDLDCETIMGASNHDDEAFVEAAAARMDNEEFIDAVFKCADTDGMIDVLVERYPIHVRAAIAQRFPEQRPLATYYVVNVSHNGRHLFATAEHSLTTLEAARQMYDDLRSKYPESDGYEVMCSGWAKVGHDVDFTEEG